ncbi:MAG: EAL domain-containing protein [Geminicoccaceae bacterium]|nr:EAL domain-containing protein [Geminicoccaceae bacterium]
MLKRLARLRRPLAYCILIVTLTLAGYHGLDTLTRLRTDVSQARGVSFESPDPQLFVLEYQRLRTSLARYVSDDPAVDHDTLMMHFDILWARCETMQQGTYFRTMRQDLNVDVIARDIHAFLVDHEQRFLDLRRNDTDELINLQAELEPFDRRLTEYLINLSTARLGWIKAYRSNLTRIVEEIDRLGPAIALLAAVLLIMLGFETSMARRAEARVREREEQARHLAEHDPLTGLANRSLLAIQMGQALDAACRGGYGVVLMALDLDGFKSINDTFGHDTGDQLLQVVAERLTSVMEDRGTVARLGGDEFAILMTHAPDETQTGNIACKVVALLEQPIRLRNRELHVSTSIGIARYPDNCADAASLLSQADVALYAAKAEGKRTHRHYVAAMGRKIIRRKDIERGLRRAMADDSLEMHYQPQVRVGDRRIAGVEALCRWTDPELGRVPPDEFIAVAEESGLIFDLDRWVIEAVVRQMSNWPQALSSLKVAINLSPAQFLFDTIGRDLNDISSRHAVDPGRLTLEITEGALMRDTEKTLLQLRMLREQGVRLAIDDFGKGYSSLSYLRKFRLDQLKIDRSFVIGIESDAGARAVIRGILALATSLGLTTTAEGVEDEQQMEFLHHERCTLAQGYLFSPAVPSDRLVELVVADNNHVRTADFANPVL